MLITGCLCSCVCVYIPEVSINLLSLSFNSVFPWFSAISSQVWISICMWFILPLLTQNYACMKRHTCNIHYL